MKSFKIAAAQVASVRGDWERNLRTHANAIEAAGRRNVSLLIFPELSLTGYELDLAAEFAIESSDERLAPLAVLAKCFQMAVVVGTPLKIGEGLPGLGAVILEDTGNRRSYIKMHLGGTEPTYFAPGAEWLILANGAENVGLAICADASKASHPQGYLEQGGSIYAAGVFLNEEWYATDAPRLRAYSTQFGMLVVMANHADSVGTFQSVGKSAIWSPRGEPVAEADGDASCLVIGERTLNGWRGEVVKI